MGLCLAILLAVGAGGFRIAPPPHAAYGSVGDALPDRASAQPGQLVDLQELGILKDHPGHGGALPAVPELNQAALMAVGYLLGVCRRQR